MEENQGATSEAGLEGKQSDPSESRPLNMDSELTLNCNVESGTEKHSQVTLTDSDYSKNAHYQAKYDDVIVGKDTVESECSKRENDVESTPSVESETGKLREKPEIWEKSDLSDIAHEDSVMDRDDRINDHDMEASLGDDQMTNVDDSVNKENVIDESGRLKENLADDASHGRKNIEMELREYVESAVDDVESCVPNIIVTSDTQTGDDTPDEPTQTSSQEDGSDTTDDWVITSDVSTDTEHSLPPEANPTEHSSQPEANPTEHSSQPEANPTEHPPQLEANPTEHSSQPEANPTEHPPQLEANPAEHSPQPEANPTEHPPQLEANPTEHSSQPEANPTEHPPQQEANPAEHSPQSEANLGLNCDDLITPTESEPDTIVVSIVAEQCVSQPENKETGTENMRIAQPETKVVSIEKEMEEERHVPQDDNVVFSQTITEFPVDLKHITSDDMTSVSTDRERGDISDVASYDKQIDTTDTADKSSVIQLGYQPVDSTLVLGNLETTLKGHTDVSVDDKQLKEAGESYKTSSSEDFHQDLENTDTSRIRNGLDEHSGIATLNSGDVTLNSGVVTLNSVITTLNQDVAGEVSEYESQNKYGAPENFQISNVILEEEDRLLSVQPHADEVDSTGRGEIEKVSKGLAYQIQEQDINVSDNAEGQNCFTHSDMDQDAGKSDSNVLSVQALSLEEAAVLPGCEVAADDVPKKSSPTNCNDVTADDVPEKSSPTNCNDVTADDVPEKSSPTNCNDVTADETFLRSSASDSGNTERHSDDSDGRQNEKRGPATVDDKVKDVRAKPTPSRCLRAALQVGLVALIGVGSAAVTPFALAVAGFEAGGIAAGSVAESLMALVSSTGYGAAVISMLEAAGSAGLDVTTQVLIGLLSAGTAGGVVLVSEVLGGHKTSPQKTRSDEVKVVDVEGSDQPKVTEEDQVAPCCYSGQLDIDDHSEILARGEVVTRSADHMEEKEVTEEINDLDSHH